MFVGARSSIGDVQVALGPAALPESGCCRGAGVAAVFESGVKRMAASCGPADGG